MASRLVPVDELVTVDEIAKRLRMSVNSACNLVRGRDNRHKVKFPKPLVGRGTHAVWLWQDVADWKATVAPKNTVARSKAIRPEEMTFKQPNWTPGRVA